MSQSNLKINLSTLGCAKNEADSENMLGLLQAAGYRVTASPQSADICIVNTCTFISGSTKQSLDRILEMVDEGKKIIVAGCLAQRYQEELFKEIPEVNALIGTSDIERIGEAVHWVNNNPSAQKSFLNASKGGYIASAKTPRLRLSGGVSAYVKISEGCNHRCTFCIIPQLRGDLQSRAMDDIVEEVRQLGEEGVKEVILVSQDSSAYGLDLHRGQWLLAELLRRLDLETEVPWIRLMYWYPAEVTRATLEVIAGSKRILPYIDIPLQHSHPELLRSMKRPINSKATLDMIREILPQAAIRTTFIVGYPGETEEHFAHLMDFVAEQRFERVGVFTYSSEEGTVAADLPNPVPEKTKKSRRRKLMELQAGISLTKNRALVGTTEQVLLVREIEDNLIGRTWRDAPEIDGQVILADLSAEKRQSLLGEFVSVAVTGADEYDLQAHCIA